jgi:hypothetical protein
MSSINDEIKDYKNGGIVQIFRKWEAYAIDPYSLAYHRAFDSFKDTLDKQKAFDKIQMELVFTALSLCGGSIFTAAFGAITAKKLVGDVAVDVICKYNMDRAFKVATFVSENKTAEFIIGGAWDAGSKLLGDKIKNSLQENAANFPAIEAIVKKPYEIDAALKAFRLTCEIRYFDALEALLDVKDNKIKSNIFELIKKSPMCSPPNKKYFPENFEDYIELSFYMRLVLDTDHLVTYFTAPGMGMYGGNPYVQTSSKAIEATPDKKEYPTGTISKGSYLSTEFTSVEYDNVGQDVIDRMNKLYKKIFKDEKPFIDSKWFGEYTNKNILYKATQVLNSIANQNATMIQQQAAAK